MGAKGRSALAIKRSKVMDRPRERARILARELAYATVRENRARWVVGYLSGVIEGLIGGVKARAVHDEAELRAAKVHGGAASVEEEDMPF